VRIAAALAAEVYALVLSRRFEEPSVPRPHAELARAP
jgi:hypothetical protein